MKNINKNNKLINDIVLIGFQTYEYDLYKKIQRNIDGLFFDDAIDKLEELGCWFKPFYKGEHSYQDIEDYEEKYYYLIMIENNN